MTNFAKQAVIIALRKMFAPEAHFNICVLREILELMKIYVSKQDILPFEILHCVNYRDMPPGFRKELAEKVMVLLSRCPEEEFCFDGIFKQAPPLEALPSPVEPPKNSILKLIGL